MSFSLKKIRTVYNSVVISFFRDVCTVVVRKLQPKAWSNYYVLKTQGSRHDKQQGCQVKLFFTKLLQHFVLISQECIVGSRTLGGEEANEFFKKPPLGGLCAWLTDCNLLKSYFLVPQENFDFDLVIFP